MLLRQMVSTATGTGALIHPKIGYAEVGHAALCSLERCLFSAVPFLLTAGFYLGLDRHKGRTGIRTQGGVSPTLAFKASAFGRSAILPEELWRDWGSDPALLT